MLKTTWNILTCHQVWESVQKKHILCFFMFSFQLRLLILVILETLVELYATIAWGFLFKNGTMIFWFIILSALTNTVYEDPCWNMLNHGWRTKMNSKGTLGSIAVETHLKFCFNQMHILKIYTLGWKGRSRQCNVGSSVIDVNKLLRGT